MRFPAIRERVVKMQIANLKNLFAEWVLLLVLLYTASGETIYGGFAGSEDSNSFSKAGVRR
jgi:hypothetical protein